MRIYILLALLLYLPLASAYYVPNPVNTGCVMSTYEGVFNDNDCDKVPDLLDNCVMVPNPEQTDIDHNGRGDMCDLVIDAVIVEPGEPLQGRSALIRAGIFNSRPHPMRNLIVKVEVPSLGISVSQPLPTLDAGMRMLSEQIIRIPGCAPPRATDIVVIVEYPVAPGQKEVFSASTNVPIMPSGECPGDPGQELTVIDIIELQDVDPVTGATYPFTIKNNWPETKAYILTVRGHEQWGIIEIQPGSVIVVPGGGSREGALNLYARPGESGQKSFTLTAQSRDDIKQELLMADIKEPPANFQKSNQFLMGVVMFIVVLVLIVLVLFFLGDKQKRHMKRSLSSKTKPKAKKQVIKSEDVVVVKPKKRKKTRKT